MPPPPARPWGSHRGLCRAPQVRPADPLPARGLHGALHRGQDHAALLLPAGLGGSPSTGGITSSPSESPPWSHGNKFPASSRVGMPERMDPWGCRWPPLHPLTSLSAPPAPKRVHAELRQQGERGHGPAAGLPRAQVGAPGFFLGRGAQRGAGRMSSREGFGGGSSGRGLPAPCMGGLCTKGKDVEEGLEGGDAW